MKSWVRYWRETVSVHQKVTVEKIVSFTVNVPVKIHTVNKC